MVAIGVYREKGKTTALWRDSVATLPAQAQVSLTVTSETLKSGVMKVESRWAIPVMEAVAGQNAAGYTAAPKIAYVNTLIATGLYHERSDLNGRKATRQLMINFMNNISTNQGPANGGVYQPLIDSLVMPN